MDPYSGQHQQIMSSQLLKNMLTSSNSQQERKPRSQVEQALKCPRCDSTNTKFCYYNNYSLSQPRYFCKSCKRYWTKGGTLRNVPVGGGCRKAKRSSSSSSSSSSKKATQDQTFTPKDPNPLNNFPHLGFDNHDLSILGNPTNSLCDILGKNAMNPSTTNNGLFDTLRSGFLGTQNNNNGQNMYYVYGNGDIGEMDNGKSGMMMLPYHQEMRVSAKKQEQSGGRVLGGFPWQLRGETNMGEVDSGITSWNGFTSSLHGLLLSPLI
ncbi:hypothetical protein Lal_00003204 [Lupinus albus]|uniref:Dof zinc finger protein n=1 Tax=Lupinus albus TaxID=3870 RepID=A0A6A4NGM0_LUPAL|nr:putative transcription factor C2C2-Dof family [Lupinus albus]KAF1883022.1 hypothetical protein Lal_00003204 [Lupinus albus]